MDVANGIPLSLKFPIDFQKAVVSLSDKDVAKATTCAISSIAWHCLGAYLKSICEIVIRSQNDPCLGFPKSCHVILFYCNCLVVLCGYNPLWLPPCFLMYLLIRSTLFWGCYVHVYFYISILVTVSSHAVLCVCRCLVRVTLRAVSLQYHQAILIKQWTSEFRQK